MEFNYIINPESGRKVSIYGKTGKKVLRKYLVKFGGTAPAPARAPARAPPPPPAPAAPRRKGPRGRAERRRAGLGYAEYIKRKQKKFKEDSGS